MSFREWLNRLWGRIPVDPVDRVDTSYEGFVVHLLGDVHTVPWKMVKTIAVQYVTGSPEPRDIHYLLSVRERDLRISLDTPGMGEFIRRLQDVPGLDHMSYKNALKYCADTPVVIWTNPEARQR